MDLDTDARHLLELARGEYDPDADDKARIERRLGLALGLGAGAAVTALGAGVARASEHALASKSVATVLAAKYAVIGSALLAVGAATYGVLAGSEAQVERPALQAPAMPAAATHGAATPAPAIEEPTLVVARPSLQPAVTLPLERAAAAAELEPARAAARPQRADAADLAREVELLHRAHAAWRARDAKRALALLREHRGRHPRSSLRLERDALQALTLCELGRKDEGAKLGRKLLLHAQSSPLRASIEQSCAL
jgi:hypothetical protein